EILRCLVGSEMCIRDRRYAEALETQWRAAALGACGIHEVPGGHFDCLGEALAQSLSKPMPEEASR
ncbi:hypothetical protein KZ844_35120, partial [Pseudomonas aeruginosa]|nr:hypothetical protein [Pseudomonas aeruginosa]